MSSAAASKESYEQKQKELLVQMLEIKLAEICENRDQVEFDRVLKILLGTLAVSRTTDVKPNDKSEAPLDPSSPVPTPVPSLPPSFSFSSPVPAPVRFSSSVAAAASDFASFPFDSIHAPSAPILSSAESSEEKGRAIFAHPEVAEMAKLALNKQKQAEAKEKYLAQMAEATRKVADAMRESGATKIGDVHFV